MNFPRSALTVFPLVLGVLVGASTGARAAETKSYVVSENDGYGLAECLTGGLECGQVVADAWCEAHGLAAAVSFGPQSLFPGNATKISTAAEPFVINCGD